MRWFWLVFCYSILCSVSSAPVEENKPYLKVNIKNTFFEIGERRAIFCEGMHLSGELEWLDNNEQIIPPKSAKAKRIYVEPRRAPDEGPLFLPLMIKSLVLDDSGVYTCRAGNLTATVKITVGIKVVINDSVETFEAEEGHSVEFSCQAKGIPVPVIQWYKENQEPISSNEKYKITFKAKSNTSVLKIMDLNHMDPGTYRCRATQEQISHFAEKICHLRVRHKPLILTSYTENEVYAILDERKNITCTAIAYPQATFTWSKRAGSTGNFDVEIKGDDEEFQVTTSATPDEQGTSNSVLTLHITNETIDSQYKCTVENPKGRRNIVFHVSLGNKPLPPTAVTAVAATANNITFEVTCENCTFHESDEFAPKADNLPILGYVFEVVVHKEGFEVPYWENGTTYTFDVKENNETTFTIEDLNKKTEYHVRVATRNLAGLSDWLTVEGYPKTTDSAAALSKSIALLAFAVIVSLIK